MSIAHDAMPSLAVPETVTRAKSPKAIDRSGPTIPPAKEDDENSYFRVNPPPSDLDFHSEQTSEFIAHHVAQSRRVVLVTSGGTTVPLERQTVRFIDNFSAGTRGATSAEYFLESGYAVIFLHRQFSLLPYSRHYSHSTNCFLDFLVEAPTNSSSAGPLVQAADEYAPTMLEVLRKYQYAKKQNLLLLVPFTTITSYLFLVRELAYKMQPLGEKALFYLAAAVSDFFVPVDKMAEHKIQSGEVPSAAELNNAVTNGGHYKDTTVVAGKKLVIDLDPVPKFLKRLVETWAPDAMIVSFKLETDPDLLLRKSQMALQRYRHTLVIGNLLQTRKFEVVFVDKDRAQWLRLPEGEAVKDTSLSRDGEIEGLIVPEVVKRHGGLIWQTVAAGVRR